MFERKRVSLTFKNKSETIQSYRDECDINKIMEKHTRYGTEPVTIKPQFDGAVVDASFVSDLASAMDLMLEAQQSFSSLPAAVRERFSNDPMNMLSFLADANNADEAVKLGLMDKPAVEAAPQIAGETAGDGGTPTLLD